MSTLRVIASPTCEGMIPTLDCALPKAASASIMHCTYDVSENTSRISSVPKRFLKIRESRALQFILVPKVGLICLL